MDSNITLLAFFAAILIVAGLVLVVIVARGGKHLNKDKYRSKWLSVERSLDRKRPESYQLSVLNADKLLDQAMREAGYKGKTMGERLKAATSRFSNANAVWAAHKLRNRIAHETDVAVSYDASRRALASFKQALKDIGAI